MTIKEIKKELQAYQDFYGGDLLEVSDMELATSKEQLAKIIDRHESHMEDMLSDAKSHLNSLRERTGLNHYYPLTIKQYTK